MQRVEDTEHETNKRGKERCSWNKTEKYTEKKRQTKCNSLKTFSFVAIEL
jgi:hypothetical protein